ncbi:hypothetical protein WSM22_07100 [Cytophagales bacterium WSM2-2]|nr:hypothetical protein WSM22_07100 [Cytophagales bacterium WSM2-2]
MKPMIKRLIFALIFSLLHGVLFSQGAIRKRVAIVIGIQNYTSISPLRNCLNDARDMASTLKRRGFEVVEIYDPLTKKDVQDAFRKYFNMVNGHPEIAGLIYYSGHGVQVDGTNYLIPVSANPQIKADLDDQCVRMDFVMQVLEEAGNSLNILIMDACRNNPFRGFSRGTERGLNVVDAPKGSYIVYSTKPGAVASDGEGTNGLFTSKLLKYINEPDLNIEQVFKKVAKDVSEESNDSQRPWISSDYTGDFYFSQVDNPAKTEQPVVNIPKSEEKVSVPVKQISEPVLNADDLFTKGKAQLASGNVSEGLGNLERAASVGHVKSQSELGQLYRKGSEVNRDYTRSLNWFKKSAAQEDAFSQNAVGEFYLNGLGVSEDYAVAYSWFEKAAGKNFAEAQFNIGTMYLNGRGVTKSEAEAVKWFTKAADQNHIPAQNKLGSLYLIGGEGLKKNKSEAIKWFRKAAALGDSWSKDTLESLGY